jgi:hypothetical protein
VNTGFDAAMLFKLAVARVLAELDPVTDSIRYDPSRVSTIHRSIRQMTLESETRLRTPKGRWDFLEACRRYLAPLHDREELIVAFGTQGGTQRHSRSRLTSIWRSVGEKRKVELPTELLTRLDSIAGSKNAEAILVHNHPHFWLRRLLAQAGLWLPTASYADRDLAVAYEQKAFAAWLRAGSAGRLRWYVVDENEIREFRLPSLDRMRALAEVLRVDE